MTTSNEFLNELRDYLKDKREEYITESDEEAMQWQEDAEHPESAYYQIAKREFETIISIKQDIEKLIDEIEDFLHTCD